MSKVTTEQVESLIQVASRLIDLMNREIGFLHDMKVAEIKPLQENKAALTAIYEQRIREIDAESGALEALEPALREELSDIAHKFDSTLTNNLIALNGVRESHDRMMKAIVDAATEHQARQAGYGNDGTLVGGRVRPGGETLSLALDRRL